MQGREQIWEELTRKLSEKGYTLTKRLSKGNSGTSTQVWRANYTGSKLPGNSESRILKISSELLIEEPVGDVDKLEELAQREIAIHRTLNHPFIPQFFDHLALDYNNLIKFSILVTQDLKADNLQQLIDS